MSSTTKILIVDDEPIGRQLLEAILVPEGYEVFFGNDGEEALKVAVNELPDIILLDVMMPKKDGFQTCMEIRKNLATAHIPIFLITALDDRDSRIRGIAAGADDYISKPFDRIEILAKIKNKSDQNDIRRKHHIRHYSELNDEPLATYNKTLVQYLIQSALPEAAETEYLSLYRSEKIMNSQHAFVSIPTPAGNCFFLVSNKLTGNDSVLANSIIVQFLARICSKKENKPNVLISNLYTYLDRLQVESNIDLLKSANFSFIIILPDTVNKTFVVTGQNQNLYLRRNDSHLSREEFQPYILQENQRLSFNPPFTAFLFSGNIPDHNSQTEILKFLTASFSDSTKTSFADAIQHQYEEIQDILVVKLML
jgi:CheY-like chemotaxis protein